MSRDQTNLSLTLIYSKKTGSRVSYGNFLKLFRTISLKNLELAVSRKRVLKTQFSHTPLSWMHILLVCMTRLFHAHTFNHSINTLAMHSYVDYVVDQ